MQPIIVHSSRATWFRYLAFTLGCVLVGAVLIRTDPSSQLGWGAVVIFGMGTVLVLRYLLDPRPRIMIDDKGIVDRTLRYGLIEWSDIQGAYLLRKSIFTGICLQLRDATKYTGRLPWWVRLLVARNARAGGTPVSLNVTGTELQAEEILSVIDQQLGARESAPATGPAHTR